MLKFTITYWDKFEQKMYKKCTKCVQNVYKKWTILKQKEKNFFDVILINDLQMQRINKAFRKINKPTDVLSFALNDAKPKIKTPLLGEIYLAPNYIKKNAKTSFEREFYLCFIHGILHLLGYDHTNRKNKKIMFDLQEKILKACKF